MVQEQGVDINLLDGDDATPLHFAASRGHIDMVRWLLKNGGKIMTDKYGKSAINDAMENEHTEVVDLLLKQNKENIQEKGLIQSKLDGPCGCHADSFTSNVSCLLIKSFIYIFNLFFPDFNTKRTVLSSSTVFRKWL